MNITNNPGIIQLFTLLNAAITLKEKFDTREDVKVVDAYLQMYNRELNELKGFIPDEVVTRGNLIRHSSFLNHYIGKGNLKDCYQDLIDICRTDIYVTLEFYLRHLSENTLNEDSYFNWSIIHPAIEKLAKPRFESKHYSDAVLAALKEINEIVKAEYKLITGIEEDGADLMRKAFSTSSKNNFTPTISLADNSTESGRNIQEGYMNIFAGVMIGIRNPKAHGNININQVEAWEKVMLCSHLMRLWDNYRKT